MNDIIALDFDGVVCDGLEECLLVSWLAFHDLDIPSDTRTILQAIPANIRRRFASCRSFVRHSGHFLVPLMSARDDFESESTFSAAYADLEGTVVNRFLERLENCRDRLRREHRSEWLGFHGIYPGITEVLRATGQPIYIVTAKDSASVAMILDQAGIRFPIDRIYGNQTRKPDALKDIAARTGTAMNRITMFDDNVPNVVEAREAGFHGCWATWGYSTPEHRRAARAAELPSMDLKAFVTRFAPEISLI